ncbi:MAG: 50S ribosomal protein L11 methyltransferase [Phenylobacterium sp.]|uniref:50S ribosomal protein L11 methyltransferase n=1 Tax=Phenylobacterium sp. TaxID=1871053 RepID=UPI00391D4273
MTYAEKVVQWLRERLARDPPLSEPRQLNLALRVLALWRAAMIVESFVRHHGRHVLQGPFAGMAYVEGATEGALLPRLIGSYESELHPHLLDMVAGGLEAVIDVGCAEGYYAVGLARLAPTCRVYAFDSDPKAREACGRMAALNGVAERVEVGSELRPEDLERLAGPRRLVFVDIEGAEDELLRPDLAPALAHSHLIVEAHEVYRPGVADRLTERFAPTHHVERVTLGPKAADLPAWLKASNHLDQLLAVWEWRLGPTPWLIMRPRLPG